jgi:adenine-specific DNA-methyltransferase
VEAVNDLVMQVRSSGARTGPISRRRAFERALVDIQRYSGDAAWMDGHDVIGSAYEKSLPGSERRTLGQFFTPVRLGRAMARWLLETNPEVILDPGCGSGSLLIAADHERSRNTALIGLDIDPLAIRMAQANVGLRAMERVELEVVDFFRYQPSEPPNAVICNPPYTRHHSMSKSTKEAIHAGFTSRLGIQFHRTASLHVLFLGRALEVSAPGARLAFITPSTWLDKNYAALVKKYVLDTASVKSIITFPADELVFEQAITTASITLIEKSGGVGANTRFFKCPSSSDRDLGTAFDASAGRKVVLTSGSQWGRAPSRSKRTGVALSEVASVHRGIATGFNAFFVLSEERRQSLGISLCSVRHCVPSPKSFVGDDLTDDLLDGLPKSARRWLLTPTRVRDTCTLSRERTHRLRCEDSRARAAAREGRTQMVQTP